MDSGQLSSIAVLLTRGGMINAHGGVVTNSNPPLFCDFRCGRLFAYKTGIVPYVCPQATGAVSGIVGAGGNFGAVMWGLIFRFGPSGQRAVLRIIAGCVIALSLLTPLINIRGYDGVFTKAKGEPDSIAEI